MQYFLNLDKLKLIMKKVKWLSLKKDTWICQVKDEKALLKHFVLLTFKLKFVAPLTTYSFALKVSMF